MVGISVESGVFSLAEKKVGSPKLINTEGLKTLVIGAFSGVSKQTSSLSKRKQYRIDKDNFDDVFRALNVSLNLPILEQPIRFNEVYDLHPDHLYENTPLFNRYKTLKRKLKTPSQFKETVDSLIDHGLIDQESEIPSNPTLASEGLLDSLLSNTAPTPKESMVQSIIKQTIAPYVEAKENPQIEEYSKALDLATNDVMRQLMHNSQFQNLEAVWRGVDLLNRRLDTDRQCLLHIMDVNSEELLLDFREAKEDISTSGLYKNIIEANTTAGGKSYDAIIVDLPMTTVEDFEVLMGVSEIAQGAGAVILSGASLDSVNLLTKETSQEGSFWHDFRAKTFAQQLYIATPKFMLRLPYGKKTAVIDSFNYEELPSSNFEPYYLWGNSAYLMLIAFCEKEQNNGIVKSLPIHVFNAEITPSTGCYLSSKEVTDLESLGVTPVQSIKGTDKALVDSWVSVSR